MVWMIFAPPSTGLLSCGTRVIRMPSGIPTERREKRGDACQRDVLESKIEHLLAIRHHELQEIHAEHLVSNSRLSLNPRARFRQNFPENASM
jgi:hypothetical protein